MSTNTTNNKKEEIRDIIEEGCVVLGTNDKCFKSILQNQRDYLSLLISKTLSLPYEEVKNELTIVNTELPIRVVHQRKQVKDFIVMLKDYVILLEMNAWYYKGLISRNYAYVSGVVTWEFNRQGKYNDETKFALISIDDFYLEEEEARENAIHLFQPMDKKDFLVAPENIKIVHVNLAKLKEKYYNRDRLDELEKSYLMLGLEEIRELEEVSQGNPILKGVKEQLEELSQDYDFLLYYDEEEHRRKVQEAMKRDGREEGISIGISRGISEGRTEEKNNIATGLLRENIDPMIISKTTGLSMKQLAQMRQSL